MRCRCPYLVAGEWECDNDADGPDGLCEFCRGHHDDDVERLRTLRDTIANATDQRATLWVVPGEHRGVTK